MNYHSDDKPLPMMDPKVTKGDWLPRDSAPDHAASDPGRSRGTGARIMLASRWFFRIVLPLLVIFGAATAMNMLVATKPEVHRREAREKAYAVQLVTASPANVQPEIVAYGTVSPARDVDLRALVSGEVIWVSPDLVTGGRVPVDSPLVRIDPFEFQGALHEAEANLAEARAKLAETSASRASEEANLRFLTDQQRLAKADLDRAETLIKSGSLTRQALESRKLILSQRQQSVEASQNNLLVLKARIDQQNASIERLDWKVDQARRNLADTTLKAPFAGIVRTKSVELGRSVSGSDTLVSLYDPDQMDVRFTVTDAQFGRLTSGDNRLVGREIKVNWKLGDVVRSHVATIERITPEVKAGDGGIEVFARVAEGSALRAGTFVELIVPDRVYENAMRIPQSALYLGKTIYLNEDGRMQPRTVSVLAYLGDDVLIDGSVLQPGDEVIATRIAEAGPGLKIILPKGAASADQSETQTPSGVAR